MVKQARDDPLDDPLFADWVRAQYALARTAERKLELVAWVQSKLVTRGNLARAAAGLPPLCTDDEVAGATTRSDSIGFAWFYVADMCSDIRLHHRVKRPIDDGQTERMLWALARLQVDRLLGGARRAQVGVFARRPRTRPAAEKHAQWRRWAADLRANAVHATKSDQAIAALLRRKHLIPEAVRTIREVLGKKVGGRTS